jgi:SNF2 family DNA or RNA helicase
VRGASSLVYNPNTVFMRSPLLYISFFQTGANRSSLLPSLKAHGIDVLLVSYHTLAAEFSNIYGKDVGKNTDGQPPLKKSKQESIFDVAFHRIVLDEAVRSFTEALAL